MDNATLITAIMAAIDAHIDSRITKALADHSPEVDLDKLRELVKPIIESQMTAAIETAMDAHNYNYNHDDFVGDSDLDSKIEEKVDEALNNIEVVTKSEVEEIVENTDLTQQVKDALKYHVSLSVSVD